MNFAGECETDPMRHAGPQALERLEPWLVRLRELPALKEKSLGVFYLKGRAFLHFHEEGNALALSQVNFKAHAVAPVRPLARPAS